MSNEKEFIEDLIKGATYQYNGTERDMTNGNHYVIDRVTPDYIELKDDHGSIHQFVRSEYPEFSLISLPAQINVKNIDPKIAAAADNYVSKHTNPEVRRMYGHHVRTFIDGYKCANGDNSEIPKRPITDLIKDENLYNDFMEIVGVHRAKHFSEAIIEKRLYVIDWRQAFEVYVFLVKNNLDVAELYPEDNG